MTEKNVVSVLAEVDFELDLLHKDLIDRRYILGLIRNLKDADDDSFDIFWKKEMEVVTKKICEEDNLSPERFKELLERNANSNHEPLRDELLSTMEDSPKLLERENAFTRISKQFKGLVETFYSGI